MYAIIDIETTGGSSTNDKITEIAVFVFDGEKVVDELVTLVNPERPIPYHISKLTGINNQMVASAPKFYEVAKQLVKITQDCVFVAHNVSFDYHFIRNEFKALGYPYDRKRLCTVRLARRLIPGHRSYSLGKLCKELDIPITARHRASGDALATVELFKLLIASDPKGSIAMASGRMLARELPPHLDVEKVNNLPEATGVYYLYNKTGLLMYVGKSNNIKKRVMTHLRNDKTGKSANLAQSIADVDYELTGSELVALLKESHEIKTQQPPFNSQQRRVRPKCAIVAERDLEGFVRLRIENIKGYQTPPLSFFSKTEANAVLERMVRRFELCHSLCGLYSAGDACFGYKLRQCRGACLQQEDPDSYNERVAQALQHLEYRKPNLMLIDKGKSEDLRSVVLIENGRYQGFGFVPVSEAHLPPEDLREWVKPYDDNRDIHHIIRGYLRQNKVERIIEF
ncbi:MAG: exonuclease domain-containing protein [Salibacteraceae bacterium]